MITIEIKLRDEAGIIPDRDLAELVKGWTDEMNLPLWLEAYAYQSGDPRARDAALCFHELNVRIEPEPMVEVPNG